MAVVVKCDWGLHKFTRGKDLPIGSEYLYTNPPASLGLWDWGKDASKARQFDTLEQAKDFVAIKWGQDKLNGLTFEFLDSETKEVIATDARDDPSLHAAEEGEGRSDSAGTVEG